MLFLEIRELWLSFEREVSDPVDRSRGLLFLELHGAKTIRRTIIQSDSWGCESSEQIGSRLSIAESDALPRTPRREDSEAQRRRHAMTNNQPCQ